VILFGFFVIGFTLLVCPHTGEQQHSNHRNSKKKYGRLSHHSSYILSCPDFLIFFTFLLFSLHFLLLRGVKSVVKRTTENNITKAIIFFIEIMIKQL
jgi:hypothetical protein